MHSFIAKQNFKKRRKVLAAIVFSALTYCPARWLKWAAFAGWFVCEGSERSRCSQACCLQEGHWRSTDHHSEPGTPFCPAGAYGSLTKAEVSGVNLLLWSVQICLYAVDPLLSIQKMTGGGRPAGGRHCNTRETPFCTTTASFLSFDHKGDPVSQRNNKERRCIIHIMHLVCKTHSIFKWSYWTAWWKFCWRLQCRDHFELCTGTSPRKPLPFLR